MTILSGLLLFLLPFFLGILIAGNKKDHSGNPLHCQDYRVIYLLGSQLLVLLAAGVMWIADFGGMDLKSAAYSYFGITGMLSLMGMILFGKNSKRCIESIKISKYDLIPFFLILSLLPFFYLFQMDSGSDTILETMQTAIRTNSMFEYNSLTGSYLNEVPGFEQKLFVLPYFYAFFSEITGAAPHLFLYRVIPVWVLLLVFQVAGLWAEQLFEQGKEKEKRVFLGCVALLYLFGNTFFTSQPYLLFHRGYTGETILTLVLLPLLLYLIFFRVRQGLFWILLIGINVTVSFTMISHGAAFGYLLLVFMISILTFVINALFRRFL